MENERETGINHRLGANRLCRSTVEHQHHPHLSVRDKSPPRSGGQPVSPVVKLVKRNARGYYLSKSVAQEVCR